MLRYVAVFLLLLSSVVRAEDVTIFGHISNLKGSTFEMPYSNRSGPIKVIVKAPLPAGLTNGNKVILNGSFSSDHSTFTATAIRKDGFLLNRDLDPASNDNSPVGVNKVA